MENQHYRANQLVRVRCLGGTDIWTQKEIRGRVGLRNRDSTPTPKATLILGEVPGDLEPTPSEGRGSEQVCQTPISATDGEATTCWAPGQTPKGQWVVASVQGRCGYHSPGARFRCPREVRGPRPHGNPRQNPGAVTHCPARTTEAGHLSAPAGRSEG